MTGGATGSGDADGSVGEAVGETVTVGEGEGSSSDCDQAVVTPIAIKTTKAIKITLVTATS
jgi:hypothetical protein